MMYSESHFSRFQQSRRAWFKRIQKLGLMALGVWFSPSTVFAKPEDAAKAIQAITGGKPLINGKVNLVIPTLIENGNLVVLKVSVESPMTENDYVKAIHVIAEGNPLPNIFTAYLTPRSGTATLTTRVRLADSQTVWAIAQMSNGSFYQGQAETLVTLSACVESV
jgi:sulfur-oxidizing protein SoxY